MFSRSILVSAFAALAYAQSSVLSFTRVPNPITAGDATAITYATNDTSSPVTILLRQGPSGNLQTIETLTDSATNGQFIWTPSTSLPNGVDYALQITQGTQTNYYGPFSLQGGGSSSGSSASGSASAYSSSTSASATTGGAGIIGTNMTMTSSHASMGTGTTMPRNTTMSSATLSNTASRTPTATPSNTQDTGLQQTSSGSNAQETGAASMIGASSLALVFGAAAAVLMG